MIAPLDGLTVIDVTEGIAGPQCTKHLGDAGALVVKVEPLEGDVARTWGAPFVGNDSALFVELNRSKQSVALNIEGKKARDVLVQFISSADVFIHDKTPVDVDKLDISYEQLRSLNPRLVYCSLTAFGEEGPYRNLGASELTIQAMTDYLRCLGHLPEAPARLGLDAAQMNCGVFAFQAIMAALFQRARSGNGQKVTCSWFGSLLHMHGLTWAAFTHPDTWGGQHHDLYTDPPRHGYRTKDGEIFFTLGRITEEGWDYLCNTLGLPGDVRSDPRFADQGRETVGVGLYATELRSIWEKAFKTRTRTELLQLLHSVGANAVPVNTYQDLSEDMQVQAVGMFQELEHPAAGRIRTTGVPWKLSDTPAHITVPAPQLGQHTRQVLERWGYDSGEIDTMAREGTIAIQ